MKKEMILMGFMFLLVCTLFFVGGRGEISREDLKIDREIFERFNSRIGLSIPSENPRLFISEEIDSFLKQRKKDFRSMSLESDEKVKAIVILREPSSIPEWTNSFSVISEDNLNAIKKDMRNAILKKVEKRQHIYSSFNGFSAELSRQELQDLIESNLVERIEYDYPVQAFMQDTVDIINATPTWDLQLEGINLTGAGQTVCVIDTGVDYTHPDLGGCEPRNQTKEISIISPGYPSNYPNYEGEYGFEIFFDGEGHDSLKLYFGDIDIASGDYLDIYDDSGYLFGWYTNTSGEGWTDEFYWKNMTLKLETSGSLGRGFNISQIRRYNYTANCEKVIGGYDFAYGTSNPLDLQGHGTHVTGTIAAKGDLKGIAPDANIVAIKSLNDAGSGSISNIVAGIDFCIDNQERYNISVISMSLGTPCYYDNGTWTGWCRDNYCDSPYVSYSQAISRAYEKNISVVASTGNDGSRSGYDYNHVGAPACIEYAIRVGSSVKADNTLSSFSNRWEKDMLVAPGGLATNSQTKINSTCVGGEYCGKQGTSMAAPHVSGAIALINQYLVAIGKTKTPFEINEILKNTGKNVTADERNYSRIDVYSALMYLDETPPMVNLSGIENGIITLEVNQTFNCSVEDWQLKNLTFYLWNSTALYFNETKEISGTKNTSSWSFENLASENYTWTCNSSDENGNEGFTETRLFYLEEFFLEMFPSNGTNTSNNETNFTCTVSSARNLKNITFYIWNSSEYLLKNESLNISGIRNETTFNFTFQEETNYTWGCEVFNEENVSLFEKNTIIYDITSPSLNGTFSISPKTHNSATISFKTTEATNSSIELFGKENKSLGDYNLNHSYSFSGLSASTNYHFNVIFCDRAGNCNFSEGSFQTDAAPIVQTSGGGGGGSAPIVIKEEIKLNSIIIPEEKVIEKDKKVLFSLNTNSHSLKILEIENNKATFEIRSEPINLTLFIGEYKKLNLSSAEFYDFYIKLNNITNEKANITIQEILERIQEEPATNNFETQQDEWKQEGEKEIDFSPDSLKILVGGFIVFVLIVICISWIYKRYYTSQTNKTKQVNGPFYFFQHLKD